jgi:radical SAM protein with 4Fe4S-binding SPASM domain
VTVFTNGTLVTEQALDAFSAYPPHAVEVSLYGATAPTYESVTGVPGSFKQCIRGLCRLKSRGVRLRLKTVLLTLNLHELEAVEAIASDFGAPFRCDALISPGLDGDRGPVRYRVSPKEAVEREFANPERARQQHDLFYRTRGGQPAPDLYQCGAGLTMFHVDAAGWMRPCLMVPGAGVYLPGASFAELWRGSDFTGFRDRGRAPQRCRTCDTKAVCGYCPGFFQLESGSETVSSEYICDIGSLRRQAIVDLHTKEAQVW